MGRCSEMNFQTMIQRSLGMLLFATCLTSCYDPHAQESAIVREVEAHGSGDIGTFTQPGLMQWFGASPARREFAAHIAAECGPIQQSRGANWLSSTEGSVCLAANREAAVLPITADNQVF